MGQIKCELAEKEEQLDTAMEKDNNNEIEKLEEQFLNISFKKISAHSALQIDSVSDIIEEKKNKPDLMDRRLSKKISIYIEDE